MTGYQKLKSQLLPLIKGLPIVGIFFALAVFISGKIIDYSPQKYQAMAKIKLDDQKYGFSHSSLYQDFDVFTTENKIETEAEVLKSPLILGRALDSLDFDVTFYRKGKIKNTMLYADNSPFLISYVDSTKEIFDHPFEMKVTDHTTLKIKDDGKSIKGHVGDTIAVTGGSIVIESNPTAIDVAINGEYTFTIHSRDALIGIVSEKLDVKAIDKEIAILRVVYKDEHPQKTAKLVNELCKAYVEDYIHTKTQAARQTAHFIDQKINEVSVGLSAAEDALERFKRENKVVNTLQETETGLRQISKLEIQLINLEMNEKAVLELEEYVNNGEYFDETAISFGFGDLLLTELAKKLKLWNDERHDLLTKYTPQHEKIKAVDAKIEEIKGYVKKALISNKKDIITKRNDIEAALEIVSHQFDDLPAREKQMQILDRDFRLQESIYNFLSQKRIDASIASTAALSFHRVIKPALVPKSPISPNTTLIRFVGGLLGLIIGITMVYLLKVIRARVSKREDLEKHSGLSVVGVIRKRNTNDDFVSLAKNIVIKAVVPSKGGAIAITSTLKHEGKTYVTKHLGEALAGSGYKVCVLDMNSFDSRLSRYETVVHNINASDETLNFESNPSYWKGEVLNLEDFREKLKALKKHFDFVLIDSPATAVNIEGIEIMKAADASLYLSRVDFTAINYLNHADLIKEEYDLQNIYHVLNNAHKASNFSGMYLGSRFRYKKKRNIRARIQYLYNTYMK